MDKVKKLKEGLQGLLPKNTNTLITAKILEVTGQTCKVKLKSGLEVSDVRLKSSITQVDNYLIVEPKVGSQVLIISLRGDLESLTVIKVDEVQKLVYKQDGLSIEVDSTTGMVLVKNEETSLGQLMQDLVEIFKKLKVFTPVGPSGVPLPDTIQRVTKFETDFKKILKTS